MDPALIAPLVETLAAPQPALARLPEERLIAAWSETVEAFLDPKSPERRSLDPDLLRSCRLSPEGLEAGLAAVLGGVREAPFRTLLRAAAARRPVASGGSGFVLAILAGNLPGLAVQPLAAAVALRRAALLKSSSAEPWFAPAFLAALAAREEAFAGAYAAATWPGGNSRIEGPILERAGRVLAYGDQATLDDLARRAPGKLVGYGPKTSLAVVGAHEAGMGDLAAGLARDVALFDQRGCLSIAAVYTTLPAMELADALAAELARLARIWPPGPAEPQDLAAVQQLRLSAELRGLHVRGSSPSEGTVIVEPDPRFVPSPGLRTVRIHPLDDLARLPALLSPWANRLQGVALAGSEAKALRPALAALGVSRFARPGELQHPDASWHNGGIHPLDALRG
ncbi:MAG TPA: acyl-CoA reductase [Thermoanaerobaculia bacterium]|nr:acyl-CoA reductase [Thermoanaerobaculia bacterium]